MSLYPSLEDMKVDQIQKAQVQTAHHIAVEQSRRASQEYDWSAAPYQLPNPYPAAQPPTYTATGADPSSLASVYPSLMDEYMGMRLEPPSGPVPTPASAGNAVAVPHSAGGAVAVAAPQAAGYKQLVAPLSGGDLGLKRAEVTHGIREIVLCKDEKGKCGMRLRAVSKGIFVQFVTVNSPAALAGLRFGDQILQINGQNVAGFSDDKAMEVIKKAPAQRISLALRDRPFERTITVHKDSTNHVGFQYKNGKITAIAKDTSAARNGVLTDHQILEINGQNVVGLKDKEVGDRFDAAGQIVTITIMPSYVYDHMIKHMASGLVKKLMDHSVPEI